MDVDVSNIPSTSTSLSNEASGPVTPLCLGSYPVFTDDDNGDGGDVLSVEHNYAIVKDTESMVADSVYHNDIIMFDVEEVDAVVIDKDAVARADSQTFENKHCYFKAGEIEKLPGEVENPTYKEHGYKEHAYNSSPRKLKRENVQIRGKLSALQKKLKLKNQQTRRLKLRVKSLKEVTKVLQKQCLISGECASLLDSVSDVPKHILLRIQQKKKSAAFSEELKQFATTLHFYSASI